MKKELNIGCYVNGFATRHSNCVDIAMAAASGFSETEFYYYYHFLYALNNNWCENPQNHRNRLEA